MRRLRAWFCTYFFEIDDLDLLGIWTLFEDGSEEAEFAGEVGGGDSRFCSRRVSCG
ncbi:MAG: hypothetical protein ACLUW6_00295 [Coriobacteriaceae bacterium]